MTERELRVVNVRFPAGFYDQLASLAYEEDRSVAAFVRNAVREYVVSRGRIPRS